MTAGPARPFAFLLGLLVLLAACGSESAEPEARSIRSSFNGRTLAARSGPPFSFLVCGHVYGRPGIGRPRPATTMVEHVDRMRAANADFLMLLGDCFFAWSEEEIERLTAFLSAELPIPVFNAPGNHDLPDRADYERRFGPTWFAFDQGGCRMIVLDTEIDPWSLSGAQLDFLIAELARARRPETRPRAIFLFGHKPIWAGTRDTAVASLKSNTPTTLGVLADRAPELPTFNRDVRPLLREIAKEIPVWFFAGDVGAFEQHTLHLFMEKDDRAPALRYLAVGLGDLDRDAFLKVTVPSAGEPSVEAIEFRSGEHRDMTAYDGAYWMRRFLPEGLPEAALPFLDH